jgi:hypothetical protein
MSQERYKDLNLTPPQEGFELSRYKHAEPLFGPLSTPSPLWSV